MTLSEDARRNREVWTKANAEYTDKRASETWGKGEPTWGTYGVPEAELNVLGDVAGKDVIELGCGTAYFSAWLARRGARPTGVDVTENQLATARAMQADHKLEFPLIHASAEDVPLPDRCADLVLSEYGASLWCEPDAWIAEAARLLRPHGHLVFLTNSLLVALTAPPSGPSADRLVRPQREISPLRFEGEDGVEFHLSHGDWIATLIRHGFAPTGLHELYAPEGAEPTRFDWMSVEWAQRWPVEEIWTARRETT
jgi:SAM-dependent methyltransferase